MEKIKNIHFLGIGGISQSALAIILKDFGYFVSGSDATNTRTIARLEEVGIPVTIGAVSPYIEKCDLVVVSAAIKDDDIELIKCKTLNKHIISRADALGFVSRKFRNVISVAGSHGKTTTTGMISKIFLEANKNPTIHIGGELNCIKSNVLVGNKDYFITEACEYVDSFLNLKSDVSVILNVQEDHMDYFKTFSNLKKSFTKFANKTKKGGLVVFNADDVNAYLKHSRLAVGFSVEGKGLVNAYNIKEYQKGKYCFNVKMLGLRLGKFKIGAYGKHNVYNALASIIVALYFGINLKDIKRGLYKFTGVKRRFELYGVKKGVMVVHDYAHHPTEIKATLDLAKRVKRRVHIVFQPHTYSRTKALLDEFAYCFRGAESISVYKTYPAREDKSQGVDQNGLVSHIVKKGDVAYAFENYDKMLEHLTLRMYKGDMLLILGAGDIESFAKYFMDKF